MMGVSESKSSGFAPKLVSVVRVDGDRRHVYEGALFRPLEVGERVTVVVSAKQELVTAPVETIELRCGCLCFETSNGESYVLEFEGKIPWCYESHRTAA